MYCTTLKPQSFLTAHHNMQSHYIRYEITSLQQIIVIIGQNTREVYFPFGRPGVPESDTLFKVGDF
jgi:hypothetical protein